MGMIAGYMMLDEATLDSMMTLNAEEVSEKTIDIEEGESFETIDIDKIWDALHFFLTGVTAAEPIEGNKLSEAVVGVHPFNPEDENADFITCTENSELPEIIAALENFDFEKRAKEFDLLSLKQNKIYPNGIWEMDKEDLMNEFKISMQSLTDFYKKAFASKHHIIVSIL